jgi:hypothetical protein
MTAAVTKEGDRRWRVTFSHTAGFPAEYVAGGVGYALEKTRTLTGKVVVAKSDPVKEMFELEISW